MDLRELRILIGRYFLVALGVFYLCVLAGVLAAFLPEKVYATSAKLGMEINNEIEAGGGGAVQQAAFMAGVLEEKARSRTMKELVASDVDEEFRDIRVDVTAAADGPVITVRGESNSPFAAQAWVNAVADQLVAEQPEETAVVLRMIDPAPLKARPISPNTVPIILASIVVGLVAGLFAAMAADRIKQAFDTSQTIRERLDTTLLGEVPVLRRRGRERRRPIISLLQGDRSDPELRAAFDNIRANVELRMAQAGANKVAVISLGRAVGKSTVTAGLAQSMAAVRPVVAIEADLRRPTLSAHLGVRMALGLGDMAAFGYTDLLLQGTSNPNLKLLSAGIPVARPADVISSTLPAALDLLDESQETVFIDCPPLIGAVESAIVVAEAKWVILVLSSSSNDFAGLSDALQRINDAGGTLLGVVVNRVPRRRFRQASYDVAAERRQAMEVRAPRGVPAADTPPPPPPPVPVAPAGVGSGGESESAGSGGIFGAPKPLLEGE